MTDVCREQTDQLGAVSRDVALESRRPDQTLVSQLAERATDSKPVSVGWNPTEGTKRTHPESADRVISALTFAIRL